MIKMLGMAVTGILGLGASVQAQVIYIVPGSQYPVIEIAPGPYPGDPNRVVRLDIEKVIRRALTPPSRSFQPPLAPIPSVVPPPPPPQAAPPPP